MHGLFLYGQNEKCISCMTRVAWHSQLKKGFPGAAQEGFYRRVCVCVRSPHPPLQCDSPLSLLLTCSTVHKPTLQNRAGLALHTNQRRRERQAAREEDRRREGCCNTGRQRTRDESKRAPPPSSSFSFHLSSFSPLQSACHPARPSGLQLCSLYKGILLPRLSLLGEDGEERGGKGGQVAADAWQSGGEAEALCFFLITLLTASKNGRHIDWSSGSVSDVKGWGLRLRTHRVFRAELEANLLISLCFYHSWVVSDVWGVQV